MSRIGTIIDELKTALDAESMTTAFTVDETALDPKFKRQDLPATPKVYCVPSEMESDIASRSKSLIDYSIDFGIVWKLADGLRATVEPALLLTEEIFDFLDGGSILADSGSANASFFSIKNSPIYSPEHMKQSVFFSVITVTYKVKR